MILSRLLILCYKISYFIHFYLELTIKKKSKDKKNDLIPPIENYPKWRRKLYQICVHRYFDITITIVISLNVVFMATEHYNMSLVSHISYDTV